MTAMLNKKNTFRPGEFKARLPYLDKIDSDVLVYRVKNGITKTLTAVENGADVCRDGGFPASTHDIYKKLQRDMISSCNFSASQVAKELKARGIKI